MISKRSGNAQGCITLGDPRPTHQELQWGEAEAHTLVKLAHSMGLPGEARVHNRAVRSWLIEVLHTGLIVDASCHGAFDANDFLQSFLQLAGGKRLTLAEALNREVDLRGLRLLILSACQTAILDLRGARDEIRSLAAGMIQAGAQGVLASLWPVDDKATYLLIVRFAQEWFPRIEQEPPAAALARAQQWLRTVTNQELREWQAARLPALTAKEQKKAGATIPGSALWEKEQSLPDEAEKLVAIRGRGSRYTIGEATSLVRTTAGKQTSQGACPYADPIYWAGFQIIGR
jgi:CHAT domain-containing protein